jgi:hypothetical protein
VALVEACTAIPEKNLVVLSPHYDDVPLTWGGYLDALRKSGELSRRRVRIVNVFSRSTYQGRDDEGNRDTSLSRIQFATGIRLLEDLNCLDAILGHGNYAYELKGERECVLRQKAWKPGERFEFPHGNRDTFDAEDRSILAAVRAYARVWLAAEDTALLLPLCVKEHVDHSILREAVVEEREAMGPAARARLYFGEDQPYAGLADEKDWRVAGAFIDRLGLEPLDYEIDADRKAGIIMACYPSQVEESYRAGIVERSRQLADLHGTSSGMERLWRPSTQGTPLLT